nr:hypothetical protein CFP56_12923 [Quercus suber]
MTKTDDGCAAGSSNVVRSARRRIGHSRANLWVGDLDCLCHDQGTYSQLSTEFPLIISYLNVTSSRIFMSHKMDGIQHTEPDFSDLIRRSVHEGSW